MGEVASRELRNNTADVLRRVEAGETVTITVHGRPVAELRPLDRRPTWMPKEEFLRRVLPNRADPGLRTLLAEMFSETTDDIPL